ncbi:hypothetical protein BEN48_10945 [Hymenobacter glacialis]|uniref:Uncharacterized protein n=1 Tax=Hymenobacter glacialis TaxID=1908236 RepID=A0A1G1TAD9_9BACT|nr:hypothetical protein BEN48_10945 [Hymenobacter glacialis]
MQTRVLACLTQQMKKALLSIHFGFLFPFLLIGEGIGSTKARLMTLMFFAVASAGLVFRSRFAAFDDSESADIVCFTVVPLIVFAVNSYLFSNEAFYKAEILHLRTRTMSIKLFHCLASYSLMLLAYYFAF